MKRLIPLALGLSLTLAYAAPAHAQLLGSKGDAIFSAERLFGVRGEHWKVDPPAPLPTTEGTVTVISFGLATPYVPYNIPRLAFDYMVIDQLSIGGALGFAHSDESGDNLGAPTTFLVAPRVGFLHMFGRVAGIWPRGGFTYHSSVVDRVYSENGFGLNLECMFPIVVAPHFGFEFGLAFDQSLTATRNPDNGPDIDITYRSIAPQVGLFGWI